MKTFASSVLLLSLVLSVRVFADAPERDFAAIANSGEKELRPLVVKIHAVEPKAKAMFVPFDPPGTYSFDRIGFEILSPEEYKGRRWQVFVVTLSADSRTKDFVFDGATIAIDISDFGLSKAGLLELLGSSDPEDGIYLQREKIRPNQRLDGTPVKSPPSNPGQVSGVPHP